MALRVHQRQLLTQSGHSGLRSARRARFERDGFERLGDNWGDEQEFSTPRSKWHKADAGMLRNVCFQA